VQCTTSLISALLVASSSQFLQCSNLSGEGLAPTPGRARMPEPSFDPAQSGIEGRRGMACPRPRDGVVTVTGGAQRAREVEPWFMRRQPHLATGRLLRL
jgi:hypothetical protein